MLSSLRVCLSLTVTSPNPCQPPQANKSLCGLERAIGSDVFREDAPGLEAGNPQVGGRGMTRRAGDVVDAASLLVMHALVR